MTDSMGSDERIPIDGKCFSPQEISAMILQKRVGSNYRFVLSFNSALILLGALGILPPATSAMLHNLSTLGISLRSMTDLLEQKPSL